MAMVTLDTAVKILDARIDIEKAGDATGRLAMQTYAWKGQTKLYNLVVVEDYPLDADAAYWSSDIPSAIVDAWAALEYIQP
jgi:hypothetical protein